MFPMVTASDAGEGDTCDEEWQMTLEVPAADRLPSGMAATVRRSVECLLAVRCIVAVYAFDGINVSHMAEKSRYMLESLRVTLDLPSPPGQCVITPWAI